MNGDLGKVYNLINEALREIIEIRTRNETLWEQHKERSVVFKDDIKEEIKDIKKAFNVISAAVTERPCDVHEAELNSVKKSLMFSWVIFTFIVGIWTSWIMFYLRSRL